MAGPAGEMVLDRLGELPVAPREYHDFYRAPRFRWWRSLLALVMFAGAWGAAVLTVTVAAVLYELVSGSASIEQLAQGLVTPALFLANNVGIALAIPLAVATHRIVFGQRAGWLFSIKGRLRWGLLGRFLVIALVVHLVVLAAWLGTNGAPDGLRVRPVTWFLLGVVLLTTPLQAAGEEVAFRGLAARAVGSWFDAPQTGLVVSTVATAAVFTLMHAAGDLWLNLFYVCLAVGASVLTWRAGGVEAAVALHVVANLTTMLFLPFLGLQGVFERGPGAGGDQALAQAAAVLLATAAMLWLSRRLHLPVRAAPASPSRDVGGRPVVSPLA
jgi:membrane protease YdiL (CAAX protease family)